MSFSVVFYRYMSAAKVGEEILITAQVLKQGRTLAFATVDLTNKANGKLIAQGRHTKHLGNWCSTMSEKPVNVCVYIYACNKKTPRESFKACTVLGYLQQCGIKSLQSKWINNEHSDLSFYDAKRTAKAGKGRFFKMFYYPTKLAYDH